MDRENEGNEIKERQDEATSDRTLAEIENEEQVRGDASNAPTLEPDEGAGRDAEKDQDQPN